MEAQMMNEKLCQKCFPPFISSHGFHICLCASIYNLTLTRNVELRHKPKHFMSAHPRCISVRRSVKLSNPLHFVWAKVLPCLVRIKTLGSVTIPLLAAARYVEMGGKTLFLLHSSAQYSCDTGVPVSE
jgi:hypothetical protein